MRSCRVSRKQISFIFSSISEAKAEARLGLERLDIGYQGLSIRCFWGEKVYLTFSIRWRKQEKPHWMLEDCGAHKDLGLGGSSSLQRDLKCVKGCVNLYYLYRIKNKANFFNGNRPSRSLFVLPFNNRQNIQICNPPRYIGLTFKQTIYVKYLFIM